MSIFNALQDLVGGIFESAQGKVEESIGGVTDNPIAQGVQDQVSTVIDGASEAATSGADQVQTVADDVKQNIGL